MKNSEINVKVGNWFQEKFPNIIIEYEKIYKISPELAGISKPYMRIDIVAKDISRREIFGIECKTLNDHKTFRDLAAGIGQAFVIKRIFGMSYMALEVDDSFLEKSKLTRYSWLTNINNELGIGIILINRNVSLVEEAKYDEPEATTLFIPLASRKK